MVLDPAPRQVMGLRRETWRLVVVSRIVQSIQLSSSSGGSVWTVWSRNTGILCGVLLMWSRGATAGFIQETVYQIF